jgi:hypothetical protein
METKKCNTCNEIKVEEDFLFRTDTKKRRNQCRKCRKEWSYKYYRENSVKIRDGIRKSMYGITGEEYRQLLDDQGGTCAICDKKCKSGRSLAVDHCHKSNFIRGLLCSNCNKGLGNFQDNVKNLERAILYLEVLNER